MRSGVLVFAAAALLALSYDLFYSTQEHPNLRVSITNSPLASYLRWEIPLVSRTKSSSDTDLGSRGIASSSSGQKRVAVCLVGGARRFELTSPTISRYVLEELAGHNQTDIFLNAPLDSDSFKLFLLSNGSSTPSLRFAAARIFSPVELPVQQYQTEVLTSSGSPRGIQGLLQYFNLVEGCWNMISEYEKRHGFQYDWILRTRLDGYWNAPIPNPWAESVYTVPYGSQFGGLNDRLGAGNRETSRIALRRLSWLSRLHERRYRKLNSEKAFKAQLDSSNVSFRLQEFPFCILSSRRYGSWPPGPWNVPVMAITSRGPLNGAKCRPCSDKNKIVGEQARAIVKALNRGWGWSGPASDEGVELCDGRHKWLAGWERVYDEAVDHSQQAARAEVASLTEPGCVERVKAFRSLWGSWDGPQAELVCRKGFGG